MKELRTLYQARHSFSLHKDIALKRDVLQNLLGLQKFPHSTAFIIREGRTRNLFHLLWLRCGNKLRMCSAMKSCRVNIPITGGPYKYKVYAYISFDIHVNYTCMHACTHTHTHTHTHTYIICAYPYKHSISHAFQA